MTLEELDQLFEDHSAEYICFENIPQERRYSQRPDLNAFILLDKLMPGARDMVSAAEHDEIWLSVSAEEFAQAATEEEVLDLIRCGVRYDSEYESLALFV